MRAHGLQRNCCRSKARACKINSSNGVGLPLQHGLDWFGRFGGDPPLLQAPQRFNPKLSNNWRVKHGCLFYLRPTEFEHDVTAAKLYQKSLNKEGSGACSSPVDPTNFARTPPSRLNTLHIVSLLWLPLPPIEMEPDGLEFGVQVWAVFLFKA